ncbi:MAG: DUF2156 domain-containing protein [Synergistaceae bacterium]|nr:DUF2156 domain-containing protein [Synergistaceae bacterium]
MLDFQPVSLDMKALIDSYTFKFGEGSCQHSFVSSFCLAGKYGDMFCEHDNFLYTLRAKKCSDKERVYLFPHGKRDNLKLAMQNILDDAHAHNSHVKFETLTRRAMEIVSELFPGKFSVNGNNELINSETLTPEVNYSSIEGNRDFSEYVFSVENLVNLPGPALARKRQDVKKFFRDYEGHYEITRITPEHIDLIRNFQAQWFEKKSLSEYDLSHDALLDHENEGIMTALDNFSALGLSGIILFIDGEVKGYAYGAPLSEKVFDGIVQKGDRNITNIYKVLTFAEATRLRSDGYEYLNMEEDLGIEGLRSMKTRYQPAYMIEKFILTENE